MGCWFSTEVIHDESIDCKDSQVEDPVQGVLTPAIQRELRKWLPIALSEDHMLLKYSLDRDGDSIVSLLDKVQTAKRTILGIETNDGYVFGCFCSTPWRIQPSWFGTGESFLWRLKHPRILKGGISYEQSTNLEVEVFKYTGHDDMIQHCTKRLLAVGGGSDWDSNNERVLSSQAPKGFGLLVNGDLVHGESLPCATFDNPCLGDPGSKHGEFMIDKLEIWTITPCQSMAEAVSLEKHIHFVEEQARQRRV
jgi:hypothetical protein